MTNLLQSWWAAFGASLNRIAAIVGKEFLATFSDTGSRAILIVPVLLQSVLFGYGATFNLERVPWALFDASRSSTSAEMIRRIEGTRIFDLEGAAPSLTALEAAVDRGDALVGVYFPPDFEKKGEFFVAADARNSSTAGIAMGYLASITAQQNAAHGHGPAVQSIDRSRWNENGITRYAIIPALVLMLSMLQVLLLAGLSVAREREEGSFDMMLMTPANSVEILIGKAVIPTVVACAQALLIFSVGLFWFDLPFAGSYLTLGLFIGFFSVSYVGIGLAVSALAGNIQQSIIGILFIVMPTMILSGVLTSIRAMPEWMQSLTLINPLRHAVVVLRGIYFEGLGLLDLLPNLIPIGLAGVLALTWASWLFRHKIA